MAIIKDMDEMERHNLALKTSDIDVLDFLSTDVSADIRASVAANPNTSIETRTKLLKDRNSNVRSSAYRKLGPFYDV